MSRRAVTSQDVAAHAGVSQSAVSRVFSGASASKKTKELVMKSADELGYRPNVLARGLITGRSNIIGLVVAYLDNQFYPIALQLLSIELQKRGYQILIYMASGHGDDTEEVIRTLMDHQVDGIVTASVSLSGALTDLCHKANIPVVLFNRGQSDPRLSEVTSDNRAGGREIAQYLVKSGHERIGHISGWQESSTGVDRTEGFRGGLAEMDRMIVHQIDGLYRQAVAADAAECLVKEHHVDAIFVGNDHMAFAVMDRLRHGMGVRIPQDVSIVGYDDVPMAQWPAYDLTSLRQPVRRMVDRTIEILCAAIEETGAPEKLRIAGPLQIRGSTRRLEGKI